MLFGDDWPWSLAGATLNTGAMPTGIAAGAQAIMKTPWWGQQTMSKAHWVAGDNTIVTSYGTTFTSGTKRAQSLGKPAALRVRWRDGRRQDQVALRWLGSTQSTPRPSPSPLLRGTTDYGKPELDARNTAVAAAKGTGWGLIATGDTRVSDVSPSLSHDGNIDRLRDHRLLARRSPGRDGDKADVKTVPYNNRAGGTSPPLKGASDPGSARVLPVVLAGRQADRLHPSARSPAPPPPTARTTIASARSWSSRPAARRHDRIELAANDPGTCGGDNLTKGIINSWPKWSPDAVPVKANGKTYYFLVFSSARKYGDEFSKQFALPVNPLSSFKGLSQSSQLYLAAVVVDDATGHDHQLPRRVHLEPEPNARAQTAPRPRACSTAT